MSSLCSMARSILMLLVAALLLSSVALLVEGKSAKVPGKVFIDLIKNDTSINGAAIRVANIESQGHSSVTYNVPSYIPATLLESFEKRLTSGIEKLAAAQKVRNLKLAELERRLDMLGQPCLNYLNHNLYCEQLGGGRWSMVWKFSYLQVDRKDIPRARTYSKHYKQCIDLSDDWCNIPHKRLPGATEQMIVAYHNLVPVYAYKSRINPKLGYDEGGADLMKDSWVKVLDRCVSHNGVRPAVSHSHAKPTIYGISFDKLSPDDRRHNCDTVNGDYGECRWYDCKLPTSISPVETSTQMTLAIYVR